MRCKMKKLIIALMIFALIPYSLTLAAKTKYKVFKPSGGKNYEFIKSGEKKYKYLHGYGLSPFESQSENRDVYVGADLLAIQDQKFDDIHIEKVARRLIRSAIDYQLDGKALNSRKLYQQYLASTKSDSNIGQC